MAKHNGHGQAAVLTNAQVAKIRRTMKQPHHKLMFDIAIWTGERWGAIIQLRVDDVYQDSVRAIPHKLITYRAITRKAGAGGKRETRQVPVHQELEDILRAYRPPQYGYLFPNKKTGRHLTYQACSQAFAKALERANLSHIGASPHSTRHTFITKLNAAGVSLPVMQKLTGHKNIRTLANYVAISPEVLNGAIHAIHF